MLGVLHQFGHRLAGIDSGPGEDRGHAVQVGIGHRDQPLQHSRRKRRVVGRRPGFGSAELHEGLRCLCGVIKSGGKTRRAAKMVILNTEHPDIEQFVWCKAKEEKKAHTLIDAGYDSSLDGEAYSSVFFQNETIRCRPAMSSCGRRRKTATGGHAAWWVDQPPVNRYKATELMRQIAEATHQCGVPRHAIRHRH